MSSACATATGFALDLGSTSLADWWPIAANLAEGIVRANVASMRGRTMPPIRSLRVRFEPIAELVGGTLWPVRLAPAVVRDRVGNCLDLAAYHAAFLRLHHGVDARVRIVVPDHGVEGHAVVVTPRNVTVDPMELCHP
jgi:hypothetical protein